MPRWTITSMPGITSAGKAQYARHRKVRDLLTEFYAANTPQTQAVVYSTDDTSLVYPVLGLELTWPIPDIPDKGDFLAKSGCKMNGDKQNFFNLLSLILKDVGGVMNKGNGERIDHVSRQSFIFFRPKTNGFLVIRTWAGKVQILFYRGQISPGKEASNGYQWEMQYQ